MPPPCFYHPLVPETEKLVSDARHIRPLRLAN